MTENKRYVQFEFPYDDFAVKDNKTNEELWNPVIIDRLNEQDERIRELEQVLDNFKPIVFKSEGEDMILYTTDGDWND